MYVQTDDCLLEQKVAGHYSFFFSSRRRHTRSKRDWSSDVCSSDLDPGEVHEAERSERMAERLLRGEVDLLERGIALVDEEGRLAPERAEQPIRDEAFDLLLHQDRPLAHALRELDQQRG